MRRVALLRLVFACVLAFAPLRASASATEPTLVYGVVPPLYGIPPLQAVTRALPDLADLGVDVVWLGPIYESPPNDYGYAVTDYLHVRAAYGTEDDLRELVEQAHQRGVRVILDFVPNHTSAVHPWFVDANARGPSSPWFNFYARNRAGRPTHYFDWEKLFNLNYRNPDLRDAMRGATTAWIQRFHVDGFRMDAAWGVQRRAPDAWAGWIRDIRERKPDALLIAEASAREHSYFADGFDVAYDWTEQVGGWAWRGMFDHPENIAARVRDDLEHAAGPTLRFLENNDTGPRFVTRYGVGMTRVASAMLLTLPGVPCLFTGEERGAEYEPYATREPLGVSSHPELRDWLRALVALRRAHPSLRRGSWSPIVVRNAARVFAFARRDAETGEVAVVALNFDAAPVRAMLALPSQLAHPAALRDWIAARSLRIQGRALGINLPPWGAAVATGNEPRTEGYPTDSGPRVSQASARYRQ